MPPFVPADIGRPLASVAAGNDCCSWCSLPLCCQGSRSTGSNNSYNKSCNKSSNKFSYAVPATLLTVLPLVIERLTHPRESVRKKAVMALHHFVQMDPDKSGALAGMDIERHFRSTLCDKEPSVMAATLNAMYSMACANPAQFRYPLSNPITQSTG